MTIASSAIAAIATAAVIAIAAPAPARAQSVEAEVLFREGKKLLKQGKVAEACDKLDASDRIESSVGTLLNLADCRERNRQFATAWVVFQKAAAAAKLAHDGKRQSEARRREALLEAKLSYLTIEVPARSDGLVVTRNGAVVDPALWGQAVPVDPGSYDVGATAPDRGGWSQHVDIDDKPSKIVVEVPATLGEPRSPPVRAPAPPTPSSPPPSSPAPSSGDRDTAPSRWTGARKAAVVVGALGAAGVAAGIAFGVHGTSLENQSDMICPTATCNDAHALALNSDARHAALLANIGDVAGGALVAGAIVLWLVGAPHEVAPMVGADRVGLAIAGRF